jgi:hypothetical protein
MSKKTAAEISAALDKYVPKEVKEKEQQKKDQEKAAELQVKKETRLSKYDLEDNSDILMDMEDDVEFARSHIRSTLEKSLESFDRLMELADEMEHPRAYEVLAGMMKTIGSLNHDLIDLQKKRKNIRGGKNDTSSSGGNSGTGGVNVYVGNTSDLQREIKSAEKIENI